jgi:hypothetical protein
MKIVVSHNIKFIPLGGVRVFCDSCDVMLVIHIVELFVVNPHLFTASTPKVEV